MALPLILVLPMNRLIRLTTLLTIGLSISSPSLFADVDFVRDIQPIFKKRCYECHADQTREAGLRLDRKEDALAGSDSGQIIIPGKAEASLLVKLISGEDADRLMPPDGENLTVDEIAKISSWINEGAVWPDGVDPESSAPEHWAYRPLSYDLPRGEQYQGKHPIDQFILAKLHEKGIEPSPIADRYTLIKRLYYDLLGLPPTIEAVEKFIADDSADAYERLVDELLASPHFGERWGRHWLDMARYADSDGYEKDRPRYNAWKYRDWVIQAINDDLPFDQFTVEQIAGDQLPNPTTQQLLATAFHRQTLTNTEGGTDQEEFRVAAVFDRVETIGTVWLGLTVGCARCHSHKYDEISQREYYQLFAFFNNGDESTAKVPSSEAAMATYLDQKASFDAKLKELQQPLVAREQELKPGFETWLSELQATLDASQAAQDSLTPASWQISSSGGATFQTLDDGSILVQGDQAVQDVYELQYEGFANATDDLAGVRLELLTDSSLPRNGPGRSSGGNFVLSEVTVDLVSNEGKAIRRKFGTATADFSQKGFEVTQAIDGVENEKGWAVAPELGKPHTAQFLFQQPITADELKESQLKLRLSQQYQSNLHTLGRFRLVFISAAEAAREMMPEAIVKALATDSKKRDKKQQETLNDYYLSQDESYRKLKAAVENHQQQAPFNPEMVVRIIQPRTDNPRQTHVLKRGDFQQPLGVVQPNTLSTLPRLESASAEIPSRLDFARWLVSGQNPLTPRVFVNHVWSHLFGTGIVATVNDFGVRGEPATHPQLLDWLATRFIETGWSRKELIKTILLSDAYRRSSAHRPELDDLDPTNKLVYRQNRFRVEAEIVRDLYLAASGLLESRIGGPSVFPPLPPDIAAVSYANNFKWGNSDWNSRPDRPHGVAPKDDIYRRGMYTFFKRTAAHPNLVTFDCPDSNTTCVDRGTSNTPLQALQTLNNNVFVDSARAMANRLISDPELASSTDRLNRLFRLCTGRSPGESENRILLELLEDATAYFKASPEDATALAMLDDPISAAELAAWISVSRTVLNLDEFITRE